MTISRRTALKVGAAAGAGLLFGRVSPLAALLQEPLIRRPIPSTGELLPIVGLGGLSFALPPDHPEYEQAIETIRVFHALGGRVIDTAPGYGRSEATIGEALQRLGIVDDVFLATKFNALQIAAGRNVRSSGGEEVDKRHMQEQMEESLSLFGRERVDLQQVWNLGDIQSNAAQSAEPAGYLEWHLEKAQEWKDAGLTRYIGVTTSRAPQYGELEQAIGRYPIDFVQLDYSIDNLGAEERLLPAARDNGVAILVNRPFGSGALFRRARERGKELPAWAAEYGIDTWGKYFLKFILSHEAVTAVIPATGNPVNVADNVGAARGPIPDAAMRRRMAEYWEA